jgi:hypothetical protein
MLRMSVRFAYLNLLPQPAFLATVHSDRSFKHSLRRQKCDTLMKGVACSYCSNRGIDCTNKTSPLVPARPLDKGRPLAIASHINHSRLIEGSVSGLPPKPICLELIQLYLDFIHDKFHSLFHRPSLIEDILQDRTPLILVYGMLALSARSTSSSSLSRPGVCRTDTYRRFSTNPFFQNSDPRERGRQYAIESKWLLDIQDVSLTTAQACILLGSIVVTEGEAAAESVYYSAACRIAQLLNLPNRPTTGRIEKEVNLRGSFTILVSTATGLSSPDSVVDVMFD